MIDSENSAWLCESAGRSDWCVSVVSACACASRRCQYQNGFNENSCPSAWTRTELSYSIRRFLGFFQLVGAAAVQSGQGGLEYCDEICLPKFTAPFWGTASALGPPGCERTSRRNSVLARFKTQWSVASRCQWGCVVRTSNNSSNMPFSGWRASDSYCP